MELTITQKDALQEMGNIGAAHAATALSTMLMTSIEMNVPEIYVVTSRGSTSTFPMTGLPWSSSR